MRPILPLAMLVCLLSGLARAEWVQAEGGYAYPGTVTEAEACANAEDRARTDAIRKVTGENVAAEETLRCSEQGDDEAQCAHNSAVWTSLGGVIVATRNRTQQTVAEQGSFHRCEVRFEADVRISQGTADPGFTLGVSLNAAVYRDGEAMTIKLNPSQAMYVQIFQWLPYEKGEAQVGRLFPNGFDVQSRVAGIATVPSEQGGKRYGLRLVYPADQPTGRKMVDEYLMVVATRAPVVFRDSYTLDDFQKVLAEIPRNDSRIVKRAYNIVRSGE